ncbi:MAG: hypothetical protein M5R41_02300 [Bacteroidia bacterium]|nr:hypothetical protein [Bacteroidia bacterium]
MKKGTIAFLFLLIVALSMQAMAQTTIVVRDEVEEDDMFIKVGALGALTLAMNTTDYNVSRVSRTLGVGSHFGVKASIPLGRKTRVVGELSLHTLAFTDENERISFSDAIENHSTNIPGKLKTEGTFQYTMLSVFFQFSQFYIGVGYGLPASSEMKNTGDGFTIPAEGIDPAASWADSPGLNPEGRRVFSDITPADDDVNALLELRIGGEFPVVKSRIGDLNFGISMAYTFNNIIKDSRTFLPNYEDQFHLPNVMFHLAYLFNI